MPPEMENQQLVSPSWQFSGIPVGFGQGYISKECCDNTGTYPIFQLIFTCFLNWNQRWRDSIFVMLLTSLRMQQVSQIGFQECFQQLCSCWQKCILAQGNFLKEM